MGKGRIRLIPEVFSVTLTKRARETSSPNFYNFVFKHLLKVPQIIWLFNRVAGKTELIPCIEAGGVELRHHARY